MHSDSRKAQHNSFAHHCAQLLFAPQTPSTAQHWVTLREERTELGAWGTLGDQISVDPAAFLPARSAPLSAALG